MSMEEEPAFVKSPLSQRITRQGITVAVEIYGDGEDAWILEVVDGQGTPMSGTITSPPTRRRWTRRSASSSGIRWSSPASRQDRATCIERRAVARVSLGERTSPPRVQISRFRCEGAGLWCPGDGGLHRRQRGRGQRPASHPSAGNRRHDGPGPRVDAGAVVGPSGVRDLPGVVDGQGAHERAGSAPAIQKHRLGRTEVFAGIERLIHVEPQPGQIPAVDLRQADVHRVTLRNELTSNPGRASRACRAVAPTGRVVVQGERVASAFLLHDGGHRDWSDGGRALFENKDRGDWDP